jgi:hypothetical protein
MQKTLTKQAVGITGAAKSNKQVVKAVYFGLAERLLLNVTSSVLESCANDAQGNWQMPADDAMRAKIFGDPIPNVLKQVYVRTINADGIGFSEIALLSYLRANFNYLDGLLTFHLEADIDFEQLYADGCAYPSDINEHLSTLFHYAKKCRHITEMGVRTGSSTRAFLHAAPERLISYDLKLDAGVGAWFDRAHSLGLDYHYIEANTLNIRIEKTDLLFIDTLHNYDQLQAELGLHAALVERFIVFHDTVSFAEHGESYSGELGLKGIRFAIDEFLASHADWRIVHEAKNCNGLMVIERLL